MDSLYNETITMNFNEENEIKSLEITLLCNPDYFDGSYFSVDIAKNKNIKFNGLKD